MIKAKSRDFLLSICAVLLLSTAFMAIVVTAITTVDKISEEEKNKRILNNIKVKTTSLTLVGNGNFINNGPSIENGLITDYRVKFLNNGDKVSYIVEFCNDNEEEVLITDILLGQMTCFDKEGNSISCEGIIDNSYIIRNEEIVQGRIKLNTNECIKFVSNMEYSGVDREEEIQVSVEQIKLIISQIEK